MIKLITLLKETIYSYDEYGSEYDEVDGGLLSSEYRFKTKDNKYRVTFYSGEKYRVFELSFGIDTGDLNKVDTFQMSGEGDVRNILQTIGEIINDFYNQYKSEIDEIIIKGTNEKRSRVYKYLLPKYIKPEVMKYVKII